MGIFIKFTKEDNEASRFQIYRIESRASSTMDVYIYCHKDECADVEKYLSKNYFHHLSVNYHAKPYPSLDRSKILSLLRNRNLFQTLGVGLRKEFIDLEDEKIVLNFPTVQMLNKFKHSNSDKTLEKILEHNFNFLGDVQCQHKIIEVEPSVREEEQKTLLKSFTKKETIQSRGKKNTYKQFLFSGISGTESSLTEIIQRAKNVQDNNEEVNFENILLKGECYVSQIKDFDDSCLVKFILTEDITAIKCTLFISKDQIDELKSVIFDGNLIQVLGRIKYDNKYENEFIMQVNKICQDYYKPNKDTSKEKRVELHLYSQMSQLDGFLKLDQLFERLKYWGHEAIGVTDDGVVQAYPQIMKYASKTGIKALYGMEIRLIENEIPIFRDPEYIKSLDQFVVFDIETTGLKRFEDEIIEIGAVKIKNGQIIDRYNTFVNPRKTISDHIIQLTQITNEMVENAPGIESVLPEFIDFCKGHTLVAHNATFDMGFINEKLYKLNLPIEKGYIDTLYLSRFLFPSEGKHTLDLLCSRLGVVLTNHHRAVDDAQATAEAFIKMLAILEEKDIPFDTTINSAESEWPITRQNEYNAIVYAKNQKGLKNLYTLVSKSMLNYYYKSPKIPKSLLNEFREGLIIGSGNYKGELIQAFLYRRSLDEIEQIIQRYDFLELQPLSIYHDLISGSPSTLNTEKRDPLPTEKELKEIYQKIYELGKKFNKRVVATGDVRYLDQKDYIYRNILLDGQTFGQSREMDSRPLRYLKTTQEMLEEFSFLGEETAYEIVVKNTKAIADSLDVIKPIPDGKFPPEIEGADEKLKKLCYDHAIEIYGDPLPEPVYNRLNRELNSIITHKYAVLYLIASQLVQKSNADGYLVGSRGSVGSSFVATMADITEVNPLKAHYVCPNPICKHSIFPEEEYIGSACDLEDRYCPKCGQKMRKEGHNIPFEVFLGFHGDKEPDIDLNFAGEYQPIIHKYTEEIFGSDKVFRAGTIGYVKENTAYGYIKKYMERHREFNLDKNLLLKYKKKLCGIKRVSGQHPGGIMIVPHSNDIEDFTPVQPASSQTGNDVITTHFTYQSIHENILKLDLLGHDVPSSIKMLYDLTEVDPLKIPLDDKKVLSLFSSAEALNLSNNSFKVGVLGIPEFGTEFVRKMLEDTKPKTLSELIRICGLSHGTNVWKNNAEDLIKSNKNIVLNDVISTRDDIMLYLIDKGLKQETAFKIMEKVRKNKFNSDPNKEEYIENMKSCAVPNWYIESCQKVEYLFPKAHAVAYTLMCYRIAYYKLYYPEAFYSTYFTTKILDVPCEFILEGLEKVREYMTDIKLKEAEKKKINEDAKKEKNIYQILEVAEEMLLRGIVLKKPSLFESQAVKFTVAEAGKIQAPFRAINGISDAQATDLFNCINGQSFLSIEDLRSRSGLKKSTIEILKSNGILDGIQESDQISIFDFS